MMDWKAHRLLHELYEAGEVKGNLKNDPDAERLLEMGYVISLAQGQYAKGPEFDAIYEQKFEAEFLRFHGLLDEVGLLEIEDLRHADLNSLLQIKADISELFAREELTLKEVSSKYFSSSKYVRKGSNLDKAISALIPTMISDSTASQYLLVLHSDEKPTAIVLCENLDQMNRPRRKTIELWHAGGNNTAKLRFVTPPAVPLFYLCDWDYVGLSIYARIKARYFPEIQLLEPLEPVMKSIATTGHHVWNSELDQAVFSPSQKELLEMLIRNESWIEEESFGGALELLVELCLAR
jgi:hypothetical protein